MTELVANPPCKLDGPKAVPVPVEAGGEETHSDLSWNDNPDEAADPALGGEADSAGL